jgi:hypothetical protein
MSFSDCSVLHRWLWTLDSVHFSGDFAQETCKELLSVLLVVIAKSPIRFKIYKGFFSYTNFALFR